MNKILVVEDEGKLARLLMNDLKLEGFDVEICGDGRQGLDKLRAQRFDLLILDVMLPGMDGFEVVRAVRGESMKIPILMLTARAQETDKVVGLQLGADDYLTKPFSVLELLARVKALLRRAGTPPATVDDYESGRWRIDFRRQEARCGKDLVSLTSKEFEILRYLIARRGEVVTREEFLRALWGHENELPTTRTVDNQVASLRRKLGWDAEARGPKIVTVHQSGYRFVD